jgi:hypothetical protein
MPETLADVATTKLASSFDLLTTHADVDRKVATFI